MGTKYSTVTISSYNASPPADDGSQSASNQINWSKHKEKLGDPLKTAIESINTNLVTALDQSVVAKTDTYTVTAAEHDKTIEVTTVSAGCDIILLSAATAAAGFVTTVLNAAGSTSALTVKVNSGDLLNSVTDGTISLPVGASIGLIVNSSENGWNANRVSNFLLEKNGSVAFSGDGFSSGSRTITIPDASITLNDAIVNLTADANPVPGTDYLKTYDADAATEKKVLLDKVSGGVLMSEVTTTGVTEIDFTGIPAGVTHVDVFFEGFSHSDAERTNVQLIVSSGEVTAGYVCTSTKLPNAAAIETVNSTSSFVFNDNDASFAMHGVLRLTLSDATNHTWIGAGHCLLSTSQSTITVGSVTLSAALTGVRITMDGTATVDAGSVNVRYR